MEKDIMQNNARIGRFLALLCAAFMYVGGLFYRTIMPLSANKILKREFNKMLVDLGDKNYTNSEFLGNGIDSYKILRKFTCHSSKIFMYQMNIL